MKKLLTDFTRVCFIAAGAIVGGPTNVLLWGFVTQGAFNPAVSFCIGLVAGGIAGFHLAGAALSRYGAEK